MKTFSIKESFKKGWDLFTRHWVVLLLLGMIFLVLSIVQNAFDKDMSGWDPVSFIVFVAALVVQILVQIGAMKILLDMVDGKPVEINKLFSNSKIFWKYAAVSIITSIIVMAGFILLIIPGLYLISRFGFNTFALIDKNLGIKESFEASTRITEGVRMKILGLMLVMVAINVLGALALGIGLIVTVPVTALAWAYVYRTLSATSAQSLNGAQQSHSPAN